MTIPMNLNFDGMKKDMLDRVGLAPARSNYETAAAVCALFGVGLLVGAGIGLLLAPRPGAELRQDLAHRIQERAPDALAWLPRYIASDTEKSVTNGSSKKRYERHEWPPTA